MLRLGATEKALTEMVAIGEHVVGLTVTSFGLRLEPQLALSGLADVTTNLPDEDEPLDVTIAAWAKDNLGTAGVPAYWQILRPQTKFRQAHWRVHELILGAGELDAKAKGLIALAVASFRASPYWVEYFTRYCTVALAASEDELREAVLMAAHSASANTVAHGMMLEARHKDMRAKDFHAKP